MVLFFSVLDRARMQRFFLTFLAAIYFATTLAVVINRTETICDELGRATSSAQSRELNSQARVHWASNPHFSHAKKTDPDLDFSAVPLLRFTATSARFVHHAFNSNYYTFQIPSPARAPPLCIGFAQKMDRGRS
jgi:hypothetical protein